MTAPVVGGRAGNPPVTEQGHAGQVTPPWSYFGNVQGTDSSEEVPALMWPVSLRTYERMRTDSQIDALIRAVTYPLRGLRWCIDPNGARPEVVEAVARDFNLPIRGAEPQPQGRRKKRFNHDEHLRMALLAPTVYGHMFFEQVGYVDDDLFWRLTKLSPRMPRSIAKIDVARDGGLIGIVQYDGTTMNPPPIPVDHLVAYVWEKEGTNWTGRSLLRPLYKHWLIKDRLLRVDAMKNERFGLGIPTGTAPPGGDPADYQKLAAATRASENGGVGLPNGASIGVEGIRGTLPDTLGSIRYHDEAMARTFLAMFMQLGQTETGSRALGEEFVDFFEDALGAFAKWYRDTTNEHAIEDYVDWNWGEDELAPLVTWEEEEKSPLSADELANLIYRGALVVDEEMQQWIRKRYAMPAYAGGAPLPTKPGDVSQESTASPVGARRRARVAAHYGHLHDEKSHGNRPKVSDGGPGEPEDEPTVDPDSGLVSYDAATVPPGRESKPAHVSFLASHDSAHASSQTVARPGVGHREPNEIEAAAGTDFDKLQQEWQDATAKLVNAWGTVRKQQIAQLKELIRQAVQAGDADALATMQADVLGVEIVRAALGEMAAKGIATAVAEAGTQGRTLAAPAVDDAVGTALDARASSTATLLARSISEAAARNAISRYGVDTAGPDEVADGVGSILESLSDAYLNDLLGGAMTGAQNAGRMAVMGEATTVYSSELMDANTCDECASVDGTSYGSTDEAALDYPTGGYVDCLGGPRCRGTLVAVYEEETG